MLDLSVPVAQRLAALSTSSPALVLYSRRHVREDGQMRRRDFISLLAVRLLYGRSRLARNMLSSRKCL
jgi:hypothetical protein